VPQSFTPSSAREIVGAGAIDGDALITHRMPLEDYQDAVSTFRRGDGLKIQIPSFAVTDPARPGHRQRKDEPRGDISRRDRQHLKWLRSAAGGSRSVCIVTSR
jgi:hypothetical protein